MLRRKLAMGGNRRIRSPRMNVAERSRPDNHLETIHKPEHFLASRSLQLEGNHRAEKIRGKQPPDRRRIGMTRSACKVNPIHTRMRREPGSHATSIGALLLH